MATPTFEQETLITENEIRKALVDHCQLTAEIVATIDALGRSQKMNFVDAALHLGFVKKSDIDDAIAQRRVSPQANGREKSGLFELALAKVRYRRNVPEIADFDPVAPGEQLIPACDPAHPRSEKLRTLCTELLLRATSNTGTLQSRVIALVSPSPGEGRSVLAAEMAIGFSQLGRQTLLVDADLRKPGQHRIFNSVNVFGLAQVLDGSHAMKVHRVQGIPTLHLLTSGKLPGNPLELLSDGRMTRLMTLLRGTYDFVIIDTPPINQYADGLATATAAREALVVGRAHRTTHESVRELLRRLAPTQAQMVGAIVNHF